jgi:nucleotide-binding universal stress UspA family protein
MQIRVSSAGLSIVLSLQVGTAAQETEFAMTYAAIMAYVDTDDGSDNRVRLAADLADQFGAALIGIAACAPRPPVAPDGAPVASEIVAEMEAIAAELAEKKKRFEELASDANRKVEWRSSGDLPNDAIASEARAADLIVIGRDRPSNDPFRSADPAAVVLRAGRPVLAVPRTVQSLKARRILIAWQDSREARRALRDSIPLLSRADEVLVTQVRDSEASDESKRSVGDVAAYLSRHRIGASAGIMLKASGSVADELIRVADYERIDLIVAGAYGHSRLGEWIFGGVTRDLLARSPVCCLLSH